MDASTYYAIGLRAFLGTSETEKWQALGKSEGSRHLSRTGDHQGGSESLASSS